MASASTPQPSSREYYKPVKEEQDNDDEEVAENTATGASTAMVTITTTPREKMTVESCSTGEGVLVAVVSPLDDLLDCYRRCLPSASSSRQHRQNKRRKEGSPSSQQEQQPTPAVPLRGDNEKTATTKWRDPYPHEHRTNVSGDAETSASTYTQGAIPTNTIPPPQSVVPVHPVLGFFLMPYHSWKMLPPQTLVLRWPIRVHPSNDDVGKWWADGLPRGPRRRRRR